MGNWYSNCWVSEKSEKNNRWKWWIQNFWGFSSKAIKSCLKSVTCREKRELTLESEQHTRRPQSQRITVKSRRFKYELKSKSKRRCNKCAKCWRTIMAGYWLWVCKSKPFSNLASQKVHFWFVTRERRLLEKLKTAQT